jgi:hypothetical protein
LQAVDRLLLGAEEASTSRGRGGHLGGAGRGRLAEQGEQAGEMFFQADQANSM